MKIQLLVLISYSISVFGTHLFDSFLFDNIHIWRVFIKNTEVEHEEIRSNCKFDSNNAYITYENFISVRPFISLWIGQQSAIEVRSYAASMIAHLWKRLMLNQELSKISPNLLLPIITREMENEESDLFIEYFFNSQRVERGNVNEIRIKTPELIEIETGRTPNELLVKEVITVKELEEYQSLVVRIGNEIYSYNSSAKSSTSPKAVELHESYVQELLRQGLNQYKEEYKEKFGRGYITKTIIHPKEKIVFPNQYEEYKKRIGQGHARVKSSLHEELKSILTYVHNNISRTLNVNHPYEWQLLEIVNIYNEYITTQEIVRDSTYLYSKQSLKPYNCYIFSNKNIGHLFIYIGIYAPIMSVEHALNLGEQMAIEKIWRKVEIVTGSDECTIFNINFDQPNLNQFDDFQNTF